MAAKATKSVEVVWLDAWVEAGASVSPDEDHRAFVMKDIGFMVKRTKKGITLATSVSEDGTFRHPSFIPAGMIKSVRVLK